MGWSAAGPFYSSDNHVEDLGMSLWSQIFKDTNAMPRTQAAFFEVSWLYRVSLGPCRNPFWLHLSQIGTKSFVPSGEKRLCSWCKKK